LPVQELASPDTFSIGPAYPQLLASLSGWFRSRGVPREESKDLGQETIVRTLVHLKRHGRRGEDLKPLVFTIARNLLTERARRGVGNVVTLTEDIDVADPSPTPLDSVMAGEERSAVSAAIASLGPRHRRVVELWMRGETPADIARTLGIKRNAADALLHRARRRLATVLRESGQAFGGFLGLWGLRVRRTVHAIAQTDPGALVAQAAGALAAVTAAGAIAIGGTSIASPAHPGSVPRPAPVAAHSGTPRVVAPVRPATTRITTADPASRVEASLPAQRASATATVPLDGPAGSDWGVTIWHADPGTKPSDQIETAGTKALCSIGCPTVGGSK
jgi:RNA polymerase sigma-70 factor (ECF subfamily)